MDAKNKMKLLKEWLDVSSNLSELKKKETELRREVHSSFFEKPLKEGTQNVELKKGYKLKAVTKLNRSLDKDLEKIDSIMKILDKKHEEVIVYQPKLNVKEFRKMDDKSLKIFSEILTEKPGTVDISLVVPK